MELQTQSAVILSLLLVLVISHHKLGYSLINPFSLFLYIGMLFIGIAFIGLDDAMTPLKPLTWVVIGSTWASFLMGIALVEVIHSGQNAIPKVKKTIVFDKYNWKVHLILTYAFFALSMLAFAYTIYKIGTTVLLSGRGRELLNGELKLPYPIIFFFYGCILPCTLAMFGAFKWNPHKKLRRVFIVSAIVFIAISFNFWSTRAFLLHLFMFFTCLRFFNGKEFSLKVTLLLPFFAIGFFLLVAYLQTGEIISQLMLPYQYIANNIWNLDYAFDLVNQGFTPEDFIGFNFLGGVGYMLPSAFWGTIQESLGFDSAFNESVQKVKFLNTVSYQWVLYKDFGYVGMILGSFFWGLLMSWLWKKNLSKPTPLSACFYILMTSGLVLSSTGGFWTGSIFIYWYSGALFTVFLTSKLIPSRFKFPDLNETS